MTEHVNTARTPALWKVPEAAEYLRLSRSSVYRLIDAGQIPAVIVGSSIRIPAAQLARTLHDHRSGFRP